MERARRQAAGPMRVILEASKTKRRVQEPEAPDTADAPRRGLVRAAAAAPAPADAAVIVTRALQPVAATALTDPGPAVASKAVSINGVPRPTVWRQQFRRQRHLHRDHAQV
jgi:hypothetical protein